MLELNNLEYLFSSSYMIIKNETWLLNRLMKWYLVKVKKNGSFEFVNDFKILIENHFHPDKINENLIESKYRMSYKDLNTNIKVNKSIKYIDLCDVKCEKMQDIIIKYYSDESKLQIEEDDINVLSSIKSSVKRKNISVVIKFEDVKVNEIGVMMILTKECEKKCIYYLIFYHIT